jgi:hypothetical protein
MPVEIGDVENRLGLAWCTPRTGAMKAEGQMLNGN